MTRCGKDILIVDDERNIRLVLRTALEASGYLIREAGDSREALEAIDRECPDVLILDLRMVGADGMTVLEELNRRESQERPRVIVLTAHGSVPLAVRAIRLGASDFLEKPVTPDDLRISVASVLEDCPPVAAGEPRRGKTVLERVRWELSRCGYGRAESLLFDADSSTQGQASLFNLFGALHELEGRLRLAKKFYNLALRADPKFAPASQNACRLDEIETYGETNRVINIGVDQDVADEDLARSAFMAWGDDEES